MNIADLGLFILNMLAMIGIAVAVSVPFVSFGWWLKTRSIKKHIPENMAREVQNERQDKEYRTDRARRKYKQLGDFRVEATDRAARVSTQSTAREDSPIQRREFQVLSNTDDADSVSSTRTDSSEPRKSRKSNRSIFD